MPQLFASTTSRRQMLRMALLGGVASGLTACSMQQTGTVTTTKIDVARLVTDGRAIVTALQTALVIPGVAVLLGGNLVAAEAALQAADAAMTEIATLTGGSVTLVIDTARVQALVLSLLADVQTVLALLQTPPAAGVPALPSKLALMIGAATTLVPLVQAAAGLSAAGLRSAPMSEAEALRVAGGA